MLELPAVGDGDAADFDRIVAEGRPAVLRGLVSDWPAVACGASSPEQLRSYLLKFDRNVAVEAFVAPPDVGGRFFYSADMNGFNFQRGYMRLGEAIELILTEARKPRKNGIYIGSTPIKQTIPDFERENDLLLLAGKAAEARIWLGNESTVAAHFDASNNVACVVAGRRRFTLFPPNQVSNLYVGPIDVTIAGPPSSMVDLRNPDFERFPRFREALAAAFVAELEPGDAIYIPALWWHNVEALSRFNMLVNYWWQDGPPDAGAGMTCIGHGILTISHLPPAQRDAWRELFDYYVFRRHGDPAAHIPDHAQGPLAKTSPPLRWAIKEFLLRAIGSGT
jgi:hypothetical protein